MPPRGIVDANINANAGVSAIAKSKQWNSTILVDEMENTEFGQKKDPEKRVTATAKTVNRACV